MSTTKSKSFITSRSFWLVVILHMEATWRPQIIFSFFSLFRTLTLQLGLGFPQERYPLCSTTVLVVFIFTPIFFKSNFKSFIYLNLDLPWVLPPPPFPSNNIFTLLSPSILDTNPTHSILSIFYHSYRAWRFKYIINLLIHFYSPVSIFTLSPLYCSQNFTFPCH